MSSDNPKTFDDLVDLSVDHEGGTLELSFEIDFEHEDKIYEVYGATIGHREFSLTADKAIFYFVIDLYGDRAVAELYDWNIT